MLYTKWWQFDLYLEFSWWIMAVFCSLLFLNEFERHQADFTIGLSLASNMIFIFNSLLNDFLQCVVWDEQRDVTMWSDMLRCLWLFNCHHVMSCWSIHSVRHEIDKAEGKSEESNLVYTSCVTSTSEYKTLKSLLPVMTKLLDSP